MIPERGNDCPTVRFSNEATRPGKLGLIFYAENGANPMNENMIELQFLKASQYAAG